MPLASRTIRLFVSSTFNDLKAERNALQAEVFPRLHRHCLERGWSFQAIDLRWGVSTEAALDQSAMRICLAEIARCQAVTPRPNFLVLLGDRYGWRPLLDAVPAADFEALLLHLPAATRDQFLWRDDQPDDCKGWYRLDENAVVPLPDVSGPDKGVYLLLPRRGRFVDDDTWSREVERPLGAALRQAARTEWPDPADARRLKYEASATEQEIVAGALSVPNVGEHVRAFFRRIDVADGVALRDACGAAAINSLVRRHTSTPTDSYFPP